MTENEVNPMMVYRMADKEQRGVVETSELVSSFTTLLSPSETVLQAFEGLFPDPQVEKEAYEKMLSSQTQMFQTNEPLGARESQVSAA